MSPGVHGPPPLPRRSHRGFYVTAALLLGLAGAVLGITGYFRLGSDTEALRDALLQTAPGQWRKKIALHLGFCTTALVRTVANNFKLPPDAHDALQAVHGAEFGLYHLQAARSELNPISLLTRADQAMRRRGWQRVVGVVQENELVAVYSPSGGLSTRHLKCAVVVFQNEQLIVAGVSGNLDPLAEIVSRHLHLPASPALACR